MTKAGRLSLCSHMDHGDNAAQAAPAARAELKLCRCRIPATTSKALHNYSCPRDPLLIFWGSQTAAQSSWQRYHSRAARNIKIVGMGEDFF